MRGRKPIDLTHQRFGRWRVVAFAGVNDSNRVIWACVCDCGVCRNVVGANLKKGVTTSCGCLKKELISKRTIKDLTGQRFGRLAVLSRAEHNKGPHAAWLCRCDCGTERVVSGNSLRRGDRQSCGCFDFVKDLTGQRFGRLVVGEFAGFNGSRRALWSCLCDCGGRRAVLGDLLRDGRTTSCGCFHLERTKAANTTHGLCKHPAYSSWANMITRCTNPRGDSWASYGGRGITVCDRWRDSFEAFWEDMGEAWSPDLSLDRIDVNGNYEPGNVRWADDKQQNRNRRTNRMIETPLWGRITIADAADRAGIPYDVLYRRVYKGSPADRLFDPVKPRTKAA